MDISVGGCKEWVRCSLPKLTEQQVTSCAFSRVLQQPLLSIFLHKVFSILFFFLFWLINLTLTGNLFPHIPKVRPDRGERDAEQRRVLARFEFSARVQWRSTHLQGGSGGASVQCQVLFTVTICRTDAMGIYKRFSQPGPSTCFIYQPYMSLAILLCPQQRREGRESSPVCGSCQALLERMPPPDADC